MAKEEPDTRRMMKERERFVNATALGTPLGTKRRFGLGLRMLRPLPSQGRKTRMGDENDLETTGTAAEKPGNDTSTDGTGGSRPARKALAQFGSIMLELRICRVLGGQETFKTDARTRYGTLAWSGVVGPDLREDIKHMLTQENIRYGW
ncbi:uncharacterized protein E0L32_011539 [Thyridium curvatum]|uniref:Uncharacterized protein n=1 Tax=Thyridium curvatum TaxID=1093900 RepID=A0A507BPU5_9PEZI|nr:uncharacterized protein E0L32_011539 [Thyridium curvatum]TPX18790.1 hypothetical protein E0L32_011539 [Thyridium curvatum]